MNTPKSLTTLAESIGARVEILSFRMHGQFMTGFAIVDKDDNELLEIEPMYNRSSGRWLVKNKCTIPSGMHYTKSLRGFKADIKPMHTGYKFSNV